MKTPVLETRRLTLYPHDLRFAPDVQRHFNNWNIIKYMGAAVPWPYPDDGAEDFIKNSALPRMERGEAHLWAIVLKGKDECVGCIEFRLQANENAQRGFWLAEHLWGKGLMTEAVTAVNDFIFDVLGHESFTTFNDVANTASRALKKGGELIEVVEKTAPDGSTHMAEHWRITRAGWYAARQNRPV